MKRERVISFIDGFNLYHALAALGNSEFKWLDLRKLSQEFTHPLKEELTRVLLSEVVTDASGQVSVRRPKEYDSSLMKVL